MALLRTAALALGLLTRLPVPHIEPRAGDFGRALCWFPVVGAVIGAIQYLVASTATRGLPAPVASVLVVAVGAVLTGALHLDGVGDLFDAAGGRRGDPARALDIMKDSRIGAHGAVAIVLLLALKVAAMAELLHDGAPTIVAAAPTLARAVVVPWIAWAPYARSEGLGAVFHSEGTTTHVACSAAVLVALSQLPGVEIHPATIAIATGTGCLAGLWAMYQADALTGDGYGTIIEITEASVLVAALAIVE